MRQSIFVGVLSLTLGCGPSSPPPQSCPGSATDAGSPTFQCAGVPSVTATQLLCGDAGSCALGPGGANGVLALNCALAGCHRAGTVTPTDYSSLTALHGNVGLASPGYGHGMSV